MGSIRTLIAIAVVVAHSGPIFEIDITRFVGGKIAVQMFYMISGFYMALVLNTKYNFKNSYVTFITNRFLRLFPSYFAIIILSLVLLLLFFHYKHVAISPFDSWFDNSLSLTAKGFLVLSSLFFVGQDWTLFLCVDQISRGFYITSNIFDCDTPAYKFLLIPQAWTLGLEMMFYLIAPFIVRRKSIHVVILITVSLIIKFVLNKYCGLAKDPWNYRFFPSELNLFLLGALSYKFYSFLKTKGDKYLNRFVCLSIWGVMIAVIFFYRELPHPRIPYRLYDSVCLLIPITLPFIFHCTKNIKFDRMIGELSYPIYLSHWIVVICLKELHIEVITKNLGVFSILLTLIIAFCLWIFIDRPIDNFRQLRRKRIGNTIN